MPLPTSIDDLSLTADLNFPAGSDSPSQLDNVQRAHASFIAQLRDEVAAGSAGLSASSGASLVGYLPAGTGAVATTVQSKLRESASVKDFGAVGDGVADDTAAIQAALVYAKLSGKRVRVPVGSYAISSQLGFSDLSGHSIALEGDAANPPEFLASPGLAAAGDAILSLSGALVLTGITIAADVTPGKSYIPVTSTAGLLVGMCLHLKSDAWWHHGARDTYVKGEVHRISSIDTVNNKVFIDDATRDYYSATLETITITTWVPSVVEIKNISLKYPTSLNTVSNTGLFVGNTVNSKLDNVSIRNSVLAGLFSMENIGLAVNNYTFRYYFNAYPGGNCYGILERSSLGTSVRKLNSFGARRAYDANGLAGGGPTRDYLVSDFCVYGNSEATEQAWGLGNHGPSENGIFCDGFISAVATGVLHRGRNLVVKNVQFVDIASACSSISELGGGITVEGCTSSRSDYPDKQSLPSNDHAADYFFIGLDVNSNLPITIKNNSIFSVKRSIVQMRGTLELKNINVSGNQIRVYSTDRSAFILVESYTSGSTISDSFVGDNDVVIYPAGVPLQVFSRITTIGERVKYGGSIIVKKGTLAEGYSIRDDGFITVWGWADLDTSATISVTVNFYDAFSFPTDLDDKVYPRATWSFGGATSINARDGLKFLVAGTNRTGIVFRSSGQASVGVLRIGWVVTGNMSLASEIGIFL